MARLRMITHRSCAVCYSGTRLCCFDEDLYRRVEHALSHIVACSRNMCSISVSARSYRGDFIRMMWSCDVEVRSGRRRLAVSLLRYVLDRPIYEQVPVCSEEAAEAKIEYLVVDAIVLWTVPSSMRGVPRCLLEVLRAAASAAVRQGSDLLAGAVKSARTSEAVVPEAETTRKYVVCAFCFCSDETEETFSIVYELAELLGIPHSVVCEVYPLERGGRVLVVLEQRLEVEPDVKYLADLARQILRGRG